jgi:hypothetical protein
MNIVTETKPLVVCQLALERCQICLAHLYAIVHLCNPEILDSDGLAGSALEIMGSLEKELAQGAAALRKVF